MIVHELLRKIARYYIDKYFSWLFSGDFRPDTYAVYEILECRAKVEFTRALPYTIMNTIVAPASLVGLLLHEGFGTVFSEECKLNRIFSKKIQVDDREITINGWPDYYDGDKVIELKFTTHPVKEPEPRHVQQVRMYMWLTECKKGYLLYVTPKKVYEFEITQPMTESEIVDLIKNWTSPRDPAECQQCQFKNICPYSRADVRERREEPKTEQVA